MYTSKFVFILVLLVGFANAAQNNKKRHILTKKIKQSFTPSHKLVNQNFATRNGSSDPAVNLRNAKIARKIVHSTNWVSLATTSRLEDWTGYPFVNVKSISDGTKDNSTGIPYFYLTPLDDSVKDIEQQSSVSITMSIEQDNGYCTSNNLDVEGTGCTRVNMLGKIVKLEEGSDEQKFAKEALFDRHPSMEYWPADGDYFFAKLEIRDVVVLFDTIEHECVPIKVYYETKP